MLKEILGKYFDEETVKVITKHIFDRYGLDEFLNYLEKIKNNNYTVLQIFDSGFIWNNTPEGYEYWNNIYKKIHYGTWKKN